MNNQNEYLSSVTAADSQQMSICHMQLVQLLQLHEDLQEQMTSIGEQMT
jgi:hypothetical protein